MSVGEEGARRDRIWASLLALAPDRNATTAMLEQTGIRHRKDGQGIFRDQSETASLASEGVTLTLLDTGTTYADVASEFWGSQFHRDHR